MSFWSSVWETAESLATNVTTPSKPSLTGASVAGPSTPSGQTSSNVEAAVQTGTQSSAPKTPGAIIEEGWASLSSSFLEVISATPSKLANVVNATDEATSSATPSKTQKSDSKSSFQNSGISALPTTSLPENPLVEDSRTSNESNVATLQSSAPGTMPEGPKQEKSISNDFSADPLTAQSIDPPVTDSHLPLESHHIELDSSIERESTGSSKQFEPEVLTFNDPIGLTGAMSSESRPLIDAAQEHEEFGDWDSDPFSEKSAFAPSNAPKPVLAAAVSEFEDPWGDDPVEETDTVVQEKAVEPETHLESILPTTSLARPSTVDSLSTQVLSPSSDPLFESSGWADSEIEDFVPRDLSPSDTPSNAVTVETVATAIQSDCQSPLVSDLKDDTTTSILEGSSTLPRADGELLTGSNVSIDSEEVETIHGTSSLGSDGATDDETKIPLSSSPEAPLSATEPLLSGHRDAYERVNSDHQAVEESSEKLVSSSLLEPSSTTDADINLVLHGNTATITEESSALSIETESSVSGSEFDLVANPSDSPSHKALENTESTGENSMGGQTEQRDIDLHLSPSNQAESSTSINQSVMISQGEIIAEGDAPKSEPKQPEVAVSPSADVRHLQSKLDVLTRVLGERERQLASRSTLMAELQNENALLQSELQVFKAAQQRASLPSSSSCNMIEALQTEFSERIATMETKYRTALKERDRNAELLASTKAKLLETSSNLEATQSELETWKSKMASITSGQHSDGPTSENMTLPKTSTKDIVAPVPSTPSRQLLSNVFSSSPFGTPSSSNTSLVDSALSSITSLLSPAPEPASFTAARPMSRISSSSSFSSPMGPSSSSNSLSAMAVENGSKAEENDANEAGTTGTSRLASGPLLESQSLVDQLREEGAALQEKVQKYEGVVRSVKGREKQNLAEISRLSSKVVELEVSLKESVDKRQELEKEVSARRESEKNLKLLVESQKEALEVKSRALDQRTQECEAFEREGVSLKSELESSWRMVESLKREVEQVQKEGVERMNEMAEKMKTEHFENVSVLGAKSHQQQEALQKTISELREALSGNRTLRSANEEVLERRVAELEASLNHSEHLLTVAQQTADLVQAPLLKHVADLQSQLAHQQRSIEAVEESWKEQIQNREQSLSERTQELSRTQNQLRMAEQANHKLQAQYAKLELQYQEISLEHDQLMNEFTALDSLSQELKDAQDSIQTLEAQLASALAAKQQMAKNHESTLSQLNAQIQSLQTRITSLTTPGFGSIPTIRSEATQTPEKQQKGFANFEDSAAPSTPLGQASNVMTAANSSAQAIQATPKSNLQHQHANAALEAQIQKLKLEKSRLEDILANTMNSAALSEEREKKNKSLVLDMERLQERLDAALELVADQSERLQFVDEEIRETKQLYKDEISNLVSQLQTAQVKIKDLEQMLNART